VTESEMGHLQYNFFNKVKNINREELTYGQDIVRDWR